MRKKIKISLLLLSLAVLSSPTYANEKVDFKVGLSEGSLRNLSGLVEFYLSNIMVDRCIKNGKDPVLTELQINLSHNEPVELNLNAAIGSLDYSRVMLPNFPQVHVTADLECQ